MIKVKFCGIRREEDVEAVNRLQPDFAGFVFARSSRQVTAERAAELKGRLHQEIKTVAVLVNHPVEQAAQLANSGVADLLQLHGDEDAAYIARLKTLTDAKIIKAIRLQAQQDASHSGNINRNKQQKSAATDGTERQGALRQRQASGSAPESAERALREAEQADYYLFDAFVPGVYGGTGRRFDSSLLNGLPVEKPFFLAGGLHADNVAEIIWAMQEDKRLSPYFYGVDISGGIETDGYKDPVKMEAFMEVLGSAF